MNPILEQAMTLIKRFEGLRTSAYLCPAGRLTIGIGSTHHVTPSMTITKEEAKQILVGEVEEVYQRLRECVKVKLTDNQWAALLSFAHNIGITRVRASALLKKLNAGDMESAGEEFLKWKYVHGVVMHGLLKRREVEREMFRKNHSTS